MQIAFVHLTDIHFSAKTDLSGRVHPFCQAVIKEITGIKNLYLVISGDIAFSGLAGEYDKARKFLSAVKQLLTGQYPDLIPKLIIVPGNHDCDFANKDSQLRRMMLPTMNYQTLGDDNSVANQCLQVQDGFWEFYKEYNPLPDDKIYYKVEDELDGVKIVFHCLNTSWVSKRGEEPGGIFFPVKKYMNNLSAQKGSVNIGVWHHPYNWFSPNTPENNKKEFELFTEKVASAHFFGHEHEQSFYLTKNINSGAKINLLSGQLFNDDKSNGKYGFQTLRLNIKSGEGVLKKYTYSNSLFVKDSESEINLDKESHRQFRLKAAFEKSLDDIKIPLVLEGKKDIKLSDVFVFPDLDYPNNEKRFDSFLNASRLVEKEYKYSIVEGESQIGKSALLGRLYISLLEQGITPIMLHARDFKDSNIEKLVKSAFKQQYDATEHDYNVFFQLPNSQKALLIDDYQDCRFNQSTTRELLENCAQNFDKMIIMLDAAGTLMASLKAELEGVRFYSIKPLGYKKRNELIERYQMLKENTYTLDETHFVENVKNLFDNVQIILGDKLMPSYPIYILSILQALEYKPIKQNETSFGYCYHSLIHYSLLKAGVSNEDVDGYFNFLTELAYEFVSEKVTELAKRKLISFYQRYSDEYMCPSYESLIKYLKKAKIIIDENENVRFGYDYILYFLSAKKIADVIHTDAGKAIVTGLFNELHIERNASILVFITHHSKDISFIEQSLFNSMLVLEKNDPISLKKTDAFYTEIEAFSLDLKNDILEVNRSPRHERDKLMLSQDRKERALEEVAEEFTEEDFNRVHEITLPFKQSFRSIEIVGQIIKNRKGSLPRPQLMEMITELYTTGFRTIAYLSHLLASARKDIIDMINKETDNSGNSQEIEKSIEKFIQMVSLDACLSVFTKLMQSAGSRDLKALYNQVAEKMDTPAAKLVSFGINSYYGTISADEVRALAEDFKDNQVALKLLRGRVKAYVYHKNPDYKTKQKFASYLNMALGPVTKNENKGKN